MIWRLIRERRWKDAAEEALWRWLPLHLKLALTFRTMGFLTVEDERLHTREVPTITVDELAEASKVAERR